MPRRTLSLALFSLCAPVAFAHPPCPREPVDIAPVLSLPDSAAVPHLSVSSSFVGDSTVLSALRRHSKDVIDTGNCRTGDSHIEFPGPTSTEPGLGIQPPYATRAGFGMLGLPDLRSAPLNTSLTYRLDFKIAQQPLPADGDWVDVVQFEFRWNGWPDTGKNLPSTLYRLRLRRSESTDRGTPNMAEFIEVRRADPDSGEGIERVVARLPLSQPEGKTPVALQWHQRNRLPGHDDIIDPPNDNPGVMSIPDAGTQDIGIIGIDDGSGSIVNPVDSTFEILGPGNVVLYRAELPEQWAESLQFGLLNYHSPSIAPSALTPAAYLLEETLSVKEE
jgi:hypothetical protein